MGSSVYKHFSFHKFPKLEPLEIPFNGNSQGRDVGVKYPNLLSLHSSEQVRTESLKNSPLLPELPPVVTKLPHPTAGSEDEESENEIEDETEDETLYY